MINKNLVFSGANMALAGLCILLSEYLGTTITKVSVVLLFISGGYFALRFSQSIKDHYVGKQFHFLQALGMMTFGILVFFASDSLEEITTFASYIVMIFGFLEIGFGFMFFNSGLKLKWDIVIYRFVSGFLSIVGAMVILFSSMEDKNTGLIIVGCLLIMRGITFTFLAQKLKLDPR